MVAFTQSSTQVEKQLTSVKRVRRVIIIDHEPTYSLFLSKVIAGLGHEVIEITDPLAADFSELKVTDLVLLDIMLPRGGGTEALKAIARLGSNCSVALMCGAGDHPNDAVEYAEQLRLRVTGVLKKPFRHVDLETILEES